MPVLQIIHFDEATDLEEYKQMFKNDLSDQDIFYWTENIENGEITTYTMDVKDGEFILSVAFLDEGVLIIPMEPERTREEHVSELKNIIENNCI